MKMLIISHSYAPSRNARAFRWAALAEHWAAAGHEVQVVTAPIPGLPAREVVNGVRVHRIGGKTMEAVRARHTGSAPSRLKQVLKFLHDVTWKRLYWPDYSALWIRPALRHARALLQEDANQVLISVSVPFSSHVIAYFLKRRFPGVPWIVDIGDPFAFMVESPTNNHALYGSLNFAVEHRVLDSANQVSVTTEATMRRYLATFPSVSGRIHEIPPLVDVPAMEGAGTTEDGPHRLVYLGTMYRNVRGPEGLLALFHRMLEKSPTPIELHLYGNHSAYSDIFESLPVKLRQNVKLHGMVDRQDARAAMESATALINIGNDTTYQLPSKLVEYAAFSKPIINVVSRQNDSSIAFLRCHPCVLNVVGADADSDAMAETALAFIAEKRSRSDCAVDREWLRGFSLPAIASAYESMIHRAQDSALRGKRA